MGPPAVILAIATPPGPAARGIVRISGDETWALLDTHLQRRPAGVHCNRITLAEFSLPVITIIYDAPRSYTGEDSVELQLPGNRHLLQRVIDALTISAEDRGVAARRAEPGEFSARAYLAGRMSLAEAEGVAMIISAESDAELRAARLLTSGRLGELARSLADEVAECLALVEAGIDFSDQEDVVAIASITLAERLERAGATLEAQRRHAVGMEALRSTPRVILRGRTNAGKSTLFNKLLGRRRAVVSSSAGSTRDVLVEPLEIPSVQGPVEVMLIDVAGEQEATGHLDAAMRDAADEAQTRAILTLLCVPLSDDPPATLEKRTVLLRTMIDRPEPAIRPDVGLSVCALDGTGIADVARVIAARLEGDLVNLDAEALVLQPRHDEAMARAGEALAGAVEMIDRAERQLEDAELVAAEMRVALDALGELVGRVTPDDVLGRVFASFCVGK